MNRMNISWDTEDYYAFPEKKTFFEVKWNVETTGMIDNEIVIDQDATIYYPRYFYAGNSTLQDISRKQP